MRTEQRTEFLSIKDIATRLGVSARTCWRWRDEGVLPTPVRLGGRLVRWHAAVIERWIAAGCPRVRRGDGRS